MPDSELTICRSRALFQAPGTTSQLFSLFKACGSGIGMHLALFPLPLRSSFVRCTVLLCDSLRRCRLALLVRIMIMLDILVRAALFR